MLYKLKIISRTNLEKSHLGHCDDRNAKKEARLVKHIRNSNIGKSQRLRKVTTKRDEKEMVKYKENGYINDLSVKTN